MPLSSAKLPQDNWAKVGIQDLAVISFFRAIHAPSQWQISAQTLALSFKGPAIISPRMSIFVPGRIICVPPIDCFDCSQAMIIIYSVLTYMHRILGDTPDSHLGYPQVRQLWRMVSINYSRKMDSVSRRPIISPQCSVHVSMFQRINWMIDSRVLRILFIIG